MQVPLGWEMVEPRGRVEAAWTLFLEHVRLAFSARRPASPQPHASAKESRHVQCRRRAARGRSRE
jgi:hypothetical protein